MKTALITILTSLFVITYAHAQEKKSAAAPTAVKIPDIEAKDVRCEKHTGTGLADFKEALVENCNLNKPFSTSLSRMMTDEVYFYCCHKKTGAQ